MVSPSKDIFFKNVFVVERNLSWNFAGLVAISLSLSHCIAVFVSISSLNEMVSNSFPRAYRVVLLAKLQIFVSFMKRSKSLIKALKRIGPSANPCETPRIISNQSLKNDPIFTLCCLWEREFFMNLKLFSPAPYAPSFAIIKYCWHNHKLSISPLSKKSIIVIVLKRMTGISLKCLQQQLACCNSIGSISKFSA